MDGRFKRDLRGTQRESSAYFPRRRGAIFPSFPEPPGENLRLRRIAQLPDIVIQPVNQGASEEPGDRNQRRAEQQCTAESLPLR